MNFEIDPEVLKEFEYIVQLHKRYGASNCCGSVQELLDGILAAVANGSRRPGSWQREMFENMGLVANCNEHQEHRSSYGEPIA